MQLTDEQLHDLVSRDPSNPDLLRELVSRTRRNIFRRLPNPTGVCPHGHKIEWDQRGAYSSGYPIHVGENGRHLPGYCDEFKAIVNDPPSPKRARLLALLDALPRP